MQLGQLQSIESELRELGWQIAAISPDRPENLKPTVDKNQLGFRLFSDRGAVAMRAFGIAWQTDPALRERYRGFRIDLEQAADDTHFLLPVPAVYLMSTSGTVLFQYVNPDYTQRLHGDILLAAARALREQATKTK